MNHEQGDMEEYLWIKQKKKRKMSMVVYATQKHILNLTKRAGFILDSKLDMVDVEYEYQYLYILHKPYH